MRLSLKIGVGLGVAHLWFVLWAWQFVHHPRADVHALLVLFPLVIADFFLFPASWLIEQVASSLRVNLFDVDLLFLHGFLGTLAWVFIPLGLVRLFGSLGHKLRGDER